MKILLTGASRGIGKEAAIQLAEEGHELFLVARSMKNLQKVKQACQERSAAAAGSQKEDNVHLFEFDLLDIDRMDELATLIKAETSSLDALVNNAGLLIAKPFEALTIQESKKVFEVNYFAPEALIRAMIPLLERSSAGSIVNITSMAAFQGSLKFAGLSAYSASKGALATLTECLAAELEDKGIHVNALAFGAVQTDMLEEAFPGFQANTSPQEMGRFLKWFTTEGYGRFNGKMLPVTDSTP